MSRVDAGGITDAGRRFARSAGRRAFVVEVAVAVGLLVLAQAYLNLLNVVLDPVRSLTSSLPYGQRSTVATAVYSVLAVGGLGGLAAAYATVRDVDLSLSVPGREHAPLVTLAALVPAALAVGFNVAVALASDLSLANLAAVELGPGVLLGYLRGSVSVELLALTTLSVLLYHGLVQESLARVVDGDLAVLATALVTGVLLREHHFVGFSRGQLWFTFSTEGVAVAVLFVVALGVVAYAAELVDGSRLRRLAFVPAFLALALAAVWTVNAADTSLDLAYNAAGVFVLGIAAYTYDRTDSVLVPAVAYLSFAVVDEVLRSVLTAVWVAQFA